jgi:hypothetical protein
VAELNAMGFPWTETLRQSRPDLVTPRREQDLSYVSGGDDPLGEAIELSMQNEAARIAQDTAEYGTGRRAGTEVRLARALDRIADGSYVPPRPPGAVQLASASDFGRGLARLRWDRREDESAAVGVGPICGAPDPVGRCAEPYHQHGCSSLATPDIGGDLRDSGAYARITSSPWLDADGRAWVDQYGSPMELAGHVEAATGVRAGQPGWLDRAELGIVDRY